LEIATGSSIDGTGLFGAALDDGQGDRSRAPHQRKTEPGGNRTGSGGGTTGIRDWNIAAKHPAGRSPAEAPATVMMSTILGALAVIWPGLAPKERRNKGLVHNWRDGDSSLATARGRWF
jgi:hypothetical protein